jgi:hypothetical protein
MSHHHHAEHHHPRQGPGGPSLLRWSLMERLALAAAMIAALWGAVFWALR